MRYKLLVADDEELLHDLLKRTLGAQFEIVSVLNGLQVKDAVMRERPDLILLDIHMPGKGGREILLELRAEPTMRSIPVLVLTADKGHVLGEAEGLQLGADDYVQKPFNPQVLQARIEKTLRR